MVPIKRHTRSGRGLLFLAFAVLSVSLVLFLPGGMVSADPADPSRLDKPSILGRQVFEKSVSVDTPLTFRVSGKYLIVRSGQGWDKETRMSILEIPSLETKWSKKGPCHFYVLGEGQHPSIVLHRIIDESIADVDAYDLDGTHLFSKKGVLGHVETSPSGEFFCTQYSHTSVNRFIVYDRMGNELFSRQGTLDEWFSVPFSDSVIAFLTPKTVAFLDARSGRELAKVSWPPRFRGGYPLARISNKGGWMLVYTHSYLACFSPDLSIAWQESVTTPFIDASFSDDDRFVAVLFGHGDVYNLELRDAKSGQKLWSEKIKMRTANYASEFSRMSFVGNYLCYPSNDQADSSPESFLFRLEGSTGKVLEREHLEGIYGLDAIDGRIVTSSLVPNRAHKLQIEGWSDETDK